jgi:hypothetical protein
MIVLSPIFWASSPGVVCFAAEASSLLELAGVRISWLRDRTEDFVPRVESLALEASSWEVLLESTGDARCAEAAVLESWSSSDSVSDRSL